MDDAQCCQARQQLTKPLWDEFEVWLKLQHTQVLDGSKIAEAINYMAASQSISGLGAWEGCEIEHDLEVSRAGVVWCASLWIPRPGAASVARTALVVGTSV